MPKLTIRSDGYDAFKARVLTRARALDRGEAMSHSNVISFSSAQDMFRILTPKRVALLERLTADGPQSIELLAEHLNRTCSAVHRDVFALRRIGALGTTRGKREDSQAITVRPVASKVEFVSTLGV